MNLGLVTALLASTLCTLQCLPVQKHTRGDFNLLKRPAERGKILERKEEEEVLGVSSRIEKINKGLTEDIEAQVFIFGDIAVDKLGNADPCTEGPCRWNKSENGKVVIPFMISHHFHVGEVQIIREAMEEMQQATCVQFVEQTNENDFLAIQSRDGCWSFIGRRGGQQPLSLSKYGCVVKGIVEHELLHAIGFHHEQNRSDRDSYVDILFQNIYPGAYPQFRKQNTNNLGTPYDYTSIMHYGKYAFSRNHKPTIVPKPDPDVEIGQREHMSQMDIYRVNVLYEC
ncbi:high choriolytic enzyme 1-like isoform X2 [Latimeria chalumnae]